MIIDVLMILAFALGTGQSIEGSTATADTNNNFRIATDCYRNGIWYNPCPPDPDPSPSPPPDPIILDQQ